MCIRDRFGSRWLQQQLAAPNVSPESKQALFEELLPRARDLASQTFGNYVIQILLNPQVGLPEQQRALCQDAFAGHVRELSRNTYACRCIQSLIKLFQMGPDVIPIPTQDALLRELEPDVLALCTDANSNHVFQQILERVRPVSRVNFLLEHLRGH